MKRSVLVVNSSSGSAGAVDLEALKTDLQAAQFDIAGEIAIPGQDCPDRAALEAMGAEAVVVLSGDGTITSLNEKLRGWQGEMLVLPGGTMNLLSRRLHGEAGAVEIVERLVGTNVTADNIPVVCLGEREVLTGLTAGPSTRWGEVREGIRHGDVSKLAEVVPEAWSETLSEQGVWVAGRPPQAYAGIFAEPYDAQQLSVIAFRANNMGDMLGHGVAWLRRDFREGPRDDMGLMQEVTIVGDEVEIGLLIDGEHESGALPLHCRPTISSIRFVRTA